MAEWHPTEKQKILIRGALSAGGIFLVFRYLIPLLLPFLIAIVLSIPLRPAARWIYRRLRIPIGAAAGVLLAAALLALGAGAYYLGRLLWQQAAMVWERLPALWQTCCQAVYDCCCQLERAWQLEQGSVSGQVMDWIGVAADAQLAGGRGVTLSPDAAAIWSERLGQVVETMLNGSLQGAQVLIEGLVGVLVTVGATLISTTQLEKMKKARDRSLFREDINRITEILGQVFCAYGKTQFFIMLLVMGISAVGLALLGNRYFILIGILLGIVDALPILGVGSVLWPWAAVCLIRDEGVMAVGLAVIYGICFLVRQWMEARYMGDQIGLNALENLIAMYVGLKLFGFMGLFYGPISYLLLKEIIASPRGDDRQKAGEREK